MAEFRPFRALRYDPARVGDLARVVAPPYDVIDTSARDALYARSEFNAVRLILAREEDRYAAAAQRLADWEARGVLVEDPTPAFYGYAQDFSLDGGEPRRRFGIIGVVRLEGFETGSIRPHERTLAAPKADRLRLLEACRANLSPIFGLYPEADPVLEEVREKAERMPPLMDLVDDEGVRHRLWQISEPAATAGICAALRGQRILIADGHHRYETALAYRERLASAGALGADDPANFVLIYLCCMRDPGLVVLPTHRVLRGLLGFHAVSFLDRTRRWFRLRELPANPEGGVALDKAHRESPDRPRLVLAIERAACLYLAELADAEVMGREAADLAPAVRCLDVAVADRLLLRRILGVEPAAAAQEGSLLYVKSERDALAAVASGDAQIAVLVRPAPIAAIDAACRAGVTMPEKSTYFYPKLLTGLVFYPLRRGAERANRRAGAAG